MHEFPLQSPRTLPPLAPSPGWRLPASEHNANIGMKKESAKISSSERRYTSDDSFKTICPLIISTLGPTGLKMQQMKTIT